MMMQATAYTLQRSTNNIKVLLNGKLESHGFQDTESALHSIYVMEGKKQGTFFIEDNGNVFMQEELK